MASEIFFARLEGGASQISCYRAVAQRLSSCRFVPDSGSIVQLLQSRRRLCGARILDLLDFADDRLVYACTNDARGKPRACDLAYFLRFNIFKSLVYCIRIQGRYDLIINRRNIYIYTICYNNF